MVSDREMAQQPEFDPQDSCKKLDLVGHMCNCSIPTEMQSQENRSEADPSVSQTLTRQGDRPEPTP